MSNKSFYEQVIDSDGHSFITTGTWVYKCLICGIQVVNLFDGEPVPDPTNLALYYDGKPVTDSTDPTLYYIAARRYTCNEYRLKKVLE